MAGRTRRFIKRILICSDPLMTKEKEQYSNRRWLFDITSRPISMATGIQPQSFFSSLTQSSAFNRKKFFSLSDITLNIDETHFYFDDALISASSIEYLTKHINPQSDILIGYELSAQTRRLLSRAGIIYIDIWLHPIRFLDDILFAFSSNSAAISRRLFSFNVPSATFYLYADRIKVMGYKGWRRDELKIPPSSALFVGQMLNDKSVCRDGKMLSVLDFQSDFRRLAADHQQVYYSRHPYLRKGDEKILSFLKTFPNVQLTELPAYRLLSSNNIRTVMGVSSSVLTEALYFGKTVKTLFKPVIPLSDVYSEESYASIYQDFVSPHFWADVLSSVTPSVSKSRIQFIDTKDKLRDMLGFYWNYKEVDKVEEIRSTAVMKKQPAMESPERSTAKKSEPSQPRLPGTNFALTSGVVRYAFKEIRSSTVVSFDVFDTLVERPTFNPSDIFKFMELDALRISGGKLRNFAEIRLNSRAWAKENLPSSEEIPLSARYDAIASRFGLTRQERDALLERELELEEQFCRPKFFGRKLFEAARENRKRVIIVSDTYFDHDFVAKILRRCGYSGWDALYTSSFYNKLKRSGSLFDIVLEQEAIPPQKILHVGDDGIADIKMATSRKIRALHIPAASKIFDEESALCPAYRSIKSGLTQSAVSGLTAVRHASRLALGDGSITNGQLANLGYSVLGPMFFGFAKWILDSARSEGVEDLYFLSRDGEIAKRCYDIVSAHVQDAPRSHYVLASRRAVRVSSLHQREDILEVLSTNFNPLPIKDLLQNRFGIACRELDSAVFSDHGFPGPSAIADWATSKDQLLSFFSDPRVAHPILENAAEERASLTQHYKAADMDRSRKVGFVDIGHSGTLQAGIAKIMGLQGTCGYYFATTSDVDSILGPGHAASGYVADRIKIKGNEQAYAKNILMFEAVFLNAQDSFVRFERAEGSLEPVFLSEKDSDLRKEFSKQVHDAVCEFCSDIVATFHQYMELLELSGPEASAGYEAFLSSAKRADALLFAGLTFENHYSGRGRRWILPPVDMVEREDAIWKHGRDVLLGARSGQTPQGWRKQAHKLIQEIVLKGPPRPAQKFARSPSRYFADSRSRVARALGKIVYKDIEKNE